MRICKKCFGAKINWENNSEMFESVSLFWCTYGVVDSMGHHPSIHTNKNCSFGTIVENKRPRELSQVNSASFLARFTVAHLKHFQKLSSSIMMIKNSLKKKLFCRVCRNLLKHNSSLAFCVVFFVKKNSFFQN
jgi:hypothetical protein